MLKHWHTCSFSLILANQKYRSKIKGKVILVSSLMQKAWRREDQEGMGPAFFGGALQLNKRQRTQTRTEEVPFEHESFFTLRMAEH